MPFCMLEVVEGGFCSQEVLEAVEGGVLFAGGARGDALCATLYARGCEGGLCSLEVLEVPETLEILEVQEVMRYVLLYILELVESEFYSPEVLEVRVVCCSVH